MIIIDKHVLEDCQGTINYQSLKFPKHLRDDLIQEGYIAMLEAAKVFEPSRGILFRSMVQVYALNAMRTFYKKHITRHAMRNEQFDEDNFSISHDYIQPIEDEHNYKLLLVELVKLKERDKELLQLRLEEELEFGEIGQLFGMTKQGAHHNYHKLIERFRGKLV